MKRANALLIFHLSYCFIINTYIYLEMLFLSQKYVRGSANVLRKMTGRTCQVLFTACGRELKNNLFGLLSSAYARKPTKLKNPQILKCQNPVIKCLDIHHLSEAIICETCLHLPNVICPQYSAWLGLTLVQSYPASKDLLEGCTSSQGWPERQSLPNRSSASGELSSLPHRGFMHH